VPFGWQQRKAEGMLFSSSDPELQEALPEHSGFGVSQGHTAHFGDTYLYPTIALETNQCFCLLQTERTP